MNEQEKETVDKMIRIYCKHKHKTLNKQLCESCQQLHDYAHQRLSKCPYGDEKPTCKKCPIHCYKPQMKQEIKEVMKYAGKWMIVYHPVLAIKHLIKEL